MKLTMSNKGKNGIIVFQAVCSESYITFAKELFDSKNNANRRKSNGCQAVIIILRYSVKCLFLKWLNLTDENLK